MENDLKISEAPHAWKEALANGLGLALALVALAIFVYALNH